MIAQLPKAIVLLISEWLEYSDVHSYFLASKFHQTVLVNSVPFITSLYNSFCSSMLHFTQPIGLEAKNNLLKTGFLRISDRKSKKKREEVETKKKEEMQGVGYAGCTQDWLLRAYHTSATSSFSLHLYSCTQKQRSKPCSSTRSFKKTVKAILPISSHKFCVVVEDPTCLTVDALHVYEVGNGNTTQSCTCIPMHQGVGCEDGDVFITNEFSSFFDQSASPLLLFQNNEAEVTLYNLEIGTELTRFSQSTKPMSISYPYFACANWDGEVGTFDVREKYKGWTQSRLGYYPSFKTKFLLLPPTGTFPTLSCRDAGAYFLPKGVMSMKEAGEVLCGENDYYFARIYGGNYLFYCLTTLYRLIPRCKTRFYRFENSNLVDLEADIPNFGGNNKMLFGKQEEIWF